MKVPFDEYETQALPADAQHWRNSFDSRFLRHYWLAGKPRVVTITEVKELVSKNSRTGDSKKQLLITLAEAEKPWATNVTNCDTIEQLYGPSPRGWIGKRIELYPTKTRGPTGAMVDCMRVKPEKPLDAPSEKTQRPKHRQEVSQYLHELKVAASLPDCIPIADRIAEDNELTPAETDLLLAALKRRREQLGAAGPGAA